MPEAAFEVAVNDAVARRRHVEPGDTIRLAVFGAGQVDGVGRTSDPPAHGQFDFTVTGIVRQPGDLEFQAEAQPGTVYERDDEMHWYSAALWSRFDGDIANYGTGVFARLRPGADTEALADELRTVDRNAVVDDEPDSADIFTTIARTI
ncbi:MAG TPA: ABC transporter permease, partial [Acidimicrobiia bacterium]|nr:ABC transporter permease [Acidimicrobiia bacterium]